MSKTKSFDLLAATLPRGTFRIVNAAQLPAPAGLVTFSFEQARDLICNDPGVATGAVFSLVFVKKDLTLRCMTCRLHVMKGVKGTGRKGWLAQTVGGVIDAYAKLSVYDLDKREFRMVDLSTVVRFTSGGRTYTPGAAAAS